MQDSNPEGLWNIHIHFIHIDIHIHIPIYTYEQKLKDGDKQSPLLDDMHSSFYNAYLIKWNWYAAFEIPPFSNMAALDSIQWYTLVPRLGL